jgi:hypothetical protein
VLVRPTYVIGRYDMVAWPACVVWLALTIVQGARAVAPKRPALTAAAFCVPMLLCSLVPISRMAALKPGPTLHHRRAARLAELSATGDLIVAFSYDRDHLRYYLHRAGCTAGIVSFPSWLHAQLGWIDSEADLAPTRAAALRQDAEERLGLIESVLAKGHRVWILVDSIDPRGEGPRGPVNASLLGAMADAGLRVEMEDPPGLLIAQVVRPPDP